MRRNLGPNRSQLDLRVYESDLGYGSLCVFTILSKEALIFIKKSYIDTHDDFYVVAIKCNIACFERFCLSPVDIGILNVAATLLR